MKKISLCMIIKDEEEVLKRCLDSAKDIVDEIIIVDTGSKDKSKEIAKKYTDKIYDYDWCDNFSKARNFSFSKASFEYIMWLDADDYIPPKTKKKLLALKENMDSDCYMLKYNLKHNGKTNLTYFRERILRNCELCKWEGAIHECITPYGKIERLNLCIEHRKIKISDPDRNIKIYKKLTEERELNPREMYYYARELFDHKKYTKSISMFKKFLSSKQGWIENIIDSYYMISKCYYIKKKHNKSIEFLLKLLKFIEPRPNICCLLGDNFLSLSNYYLSIYWYKLAIKYNISSNNEGFIDNKYHNFYPHLQLCVCYYKLGNIVESIKHNEMAGKYNKTSKIVINNRNFFNSLNHKI